MSAPLRGEQSLSSQWIAAQQPHASQAKTNLYGSACKGVLLLRSKCANNDMVSAAFNGEHGCQQLTEWKVHNIWQFAKICCKL